MKVLVASSSMVARPLTDLLIGSRHEVVGFLTTPDAPQGRGREIAENAFASFARVYSIPIFKANSADEIQQAILQTEAEIVVTASYGRFIRKRELSQPKYGWLNVHFSLLPRWRGASPVQRAIENGDSKTGVTIFRLDEGMDTGPIFTTIDYVMQGNERTEELLHHLAEMAVQPLGRALDLIEEGVQPQSQLNSDVTLAPKITKDEGRIEWSRTSAEIERKVRAFSQWPTAWSSLNGSRMSILSVKTSPRKLPPGTLSISEGAFVGTGDGSLELMEVKPEGKRAMSAEDWLRGARLHEGAQFS
ncbi:MAG: methionyl-tRNA formyltransferase [Actinomycetota bacterium]